MKLTTLKQLDELVAEQLGYCKYEWMEECSSCTPDAIWVDGGEYYAIKCSVWIPEWLYKLYGTQEWEEKYDSIELMEYLNNTNYHYCQYSNNILSVQELINHLHSLDLELYTQKLLLLNKVKFTIKDGI
jgi:hypothetical protein